MFPAIQLLYGLLLSGQKNFSIVIVLTTLITIMPIITTLAVILTLTTQQHYKKSKTYLSSNCVKTTVFFTIECGQHKTSRCRSTMIPTIRYAKDTITIKPNEVSGVSTDSIGTTPNEVYGVSTDGIETTLNEVYGVSTSSSSPRSCI